MYTRDAINFYNIEKKTKEYEDGKESVKEKIEKAVAELKDKVELFKHFKKSFDQRLDQGKGYSGYGSDVHVFAESLHYADQGCQDLVNQGYKVPVDYETAVETGKILAEYGPNTEQDKVGTFYGNVDNFKKWSQTRNDDGKLDFNCIMCLVFWSEGELNVIEKIADDGKIKVDQQYINSAKNFLEKHKNDLYNYYREVGYRRVKPGEWEKVESK